MLIWLKDLLRRKENAIGLGILPFMLIFIALGTPALDYLLLWMLGPAWNKLYCRATITCSGPTPTDHRSIAQRATTQRD